MKSNTRSYLRRRAGSLAAFDALPPALRMWMKGAALPWSAQSAQRIWMRALSRSGGDPAAALQALHEAERRTLAREAPRVWGRDHPATQR